MPSHTSRDSPARRTRHNGAVAAAATAQPVRETRRSRHTTRRAGTEDGKPYYEVVETREEVTTHSVPVAAAAPAQPARRPPPHPSANGRAAYPPPRHAEAAQEYPRLAYQGNDRAPRTQQSTPRVGGSARGTPRSGALVVDPASRYVSVTNRGGPTPRGSEPTNSATRRHHASGVRPLRASGLVESPADATVMEDYETPTRHRRRDGRYAYDHGVADQNGSGGYADADIVVEDDGVDEVSAATPVPYHFRVRVHECQGVFADLMESRRAAPAVYFAVHTAEERGHSGVADKGSYDPVFNDEFIFTSAEPQRDALVCTLVAASSPDTSHGSRTRREKKVAECVLALHNLEWQVERKVWVPLVRRPGTAQAYEQGEVLVSIYSEDFGYEAVATEEEEATCSAAIHDILSQYAPQELHRLDWMTAAYVEKGPEALVQLRASYRARTVAPVPVRVTVLHVDGLTDEAGGPTRATDVYVTVGDGRVERQSKTVPYRRRATVNQEFQLVLANPEVDTLAVTVYGNGRKLGEAVAGLTNLQAGKPKEVSLMLVRAADTGDASNGGQVTISLVTDTYSSPHQMSAAQEAQLRERVLAYLWNYLRDDLHRLDAIVGSIDDAEVYMQEWARTIGPERPVRRLTINVRGARLADGDGGAGVFQNGLPPRCYARISAGPTTVRTGLATARGGAVAFNDPLPVPVCDPAHDAVEVMLVADGEDGEREISRVCFGLANLPRRQPITRTLHLVANAGKRAARVQGELTVELSAEDFGRAGGESRAADFASASSPSLQRLEAMTQRSSPEKLHRVPYMLDTAPPGKAERVIEEQAKQYGEVAAAAPMTVKILGVRAFKPAVDFYVKAYLNRTAILRTRDVKGGAEVSLNIDDDNETTLRVTDAPQSTLTFKIAQHRSLRKTEVLGQAEVALAGLVRGEKNVLWLPFFRSDGASPSSVSAAPSSSSTAANGNRRGSASCMAGKSESAVKVKGNRMPNAGEATGASSPQPGSSAGAGVGRNGAAGAASPVGLLGVELQSTAFPGTTVVEYKLDGESGIAGVSAQEAVTNDVTSLVAKMRPSELPKVQPMIAQCTSLKEAHEEIRAQLAPQPIAGTVYVNIDSVELSTDAGRMQEAQGGIAVEAVCGGDRQVSRRRTEFAQDVLHHRQFYPQIRIDIPDKAALAAASRGAWEASGAPALELRLLGVHGGGDRVVKAGSSSGAATPATAVNGSGADYRDAADIDSHATAESHYVGGENNINSYIKSPKGHGRRWSIKQPDEEQPTGRPSKMIAQQQQQQQQASDSHNGALTVPSYAQEQRNNSSVRQNSVSGDGDEKYYPGGVNNIRSYVGDSAGPSRRQSAARADGAATSPAQQQQYRTTSPFLGGSAAAAGGAPFRGEIGVVRLSLRALLTAPLYKLGDTLRVPIVAPLMPAKLSYRARRSPEVNQRCVVGHVTLRLTLPAFERTPESLRLGSRQSMSKVVPDFVHYYERRIGAYLRAYNAPDLVSFHYDLYERDVVSGCWPISLYDWLQALLKRYGPETQRFGPEPALPFDPEEWERARQLDAAVRREREAAFAPSEHGSRGADRRAGGGDDDDYSSRDNSPAAHARGAPASDAKRAKKHGSRAGANGHSKAPAEPVYSF